MPPETFLNSSDESDTSVEVSAEDLSPQEAKQRLKEIMKEAKLAPIQAEFSRIPLYRRCLMQYHRTHINVM